MEHTYKAAYYISLKNTCHRSIKKLMFFVELGSKDDKQKIKGHEEMHYFKTV